MMFRPLLVAVAAVSLYAGEPSLHRPLDWDTWSDSDRDFHVVADSLGDGWSVLSLPAWGQDTLPAVADARYVLVRPDGTFANHASTGNRGAALRDTGKGLCASDGLRQAVASWMDSVGRSGTLVSPFATPPRDIRPWGMLGTLRELPGSGQPDVRICLAELRIPWRSESDSATTSHQTGFVVARRDGAWRLAVEGMENNPAGRSWLASADSAIRGLRRGAPDLEAFWPLLMRGGWKRTGPGFLLDPWSVDRAGSDWVACLDTIWRLGDDCLRWKPDGSLVGTPRLRSLRGWRGCLGMKCAAVDTAMIVEFAMEVLSGIRREEESARMNSMAAPKKLSDVYPGDPDPFFAIRWVPPKTVARKGDRPSPLSLCLRKNPRSCLAEGATGCFEGTGLFQSARGRVLQAGLDDGGCPGP